MALLYFADPLPEPQRPSLPHDTVHHLRHAMRARAGDEYRLFDGRGGEALVRVEHCDRRRFEIAVLERRQHPRPTQRSIELCYSPPPENRHAQILEHGCELGVTSFRPLRFERSKPHVRTHDSGARDAGASRALRVLRAAAGQCGAMYLPDVHPLQDFERFADTASGDSLLFVAERAEGWAGPRATRAEIDATRAARLFVGPEGGFTERERSRLLELGCRSLSIGAHVLRVETACLAAAAILTTADGLGSDDHDH